MSQSISSWAPARSRNEPLSFAQLLDQVAFRWGQQLAMRDNTAINVFAAAKSARHEAEIAELSGDLGGN